MHDNTDKVHLQDTMEAYRKIHNLEQTRARILFRKNDNFQWDVCFLESSAEITHWTFPHKLIRSVIVLLQRLSSTLLGTYRMSAKDEISENMIQHFDTVASNMISFIGDVFNDTDNEEENWLRVIISCYKIICSWASKCVFTQVREHLCKTRNQLKANPSLTTEYALVNVLECWNGAIFAVQNFFNV